MSAFLSTDAWLPAIFWALHGLLTDDGEKKHIARVNALFRGTYLEPAHHRVVYRYDPASFRAGVVLFLLAVATVGAVSVASVVRRRGARPAQ